MTCVVGYENNGEVYIGADSQGSSGWDKTDRADHKVFISHGILYGFTSSYRMGQILKYHSTRLFSPIREKDPFGYVVTCLVPMWRAILKEHGFTSIENNTETGGSWLLGVDENLFTIESDFQVSKSKHCYSAVGCGARYALGALAAMEDSVTDTPRSKITKAINTSMKFSNGVGGDIKILSLGGY